MWSVTKPTAQPDLEDVEHSRGTASEAQPETPGPLPSAVALATHREVVQMSEPWLPPASCSTVLFWREGSTVEPVPGSSLACACHSRQMPPGSRLQTPGGERITLDEVSLSGFVLGFNNGVVGIFFFSFF